MRHSPISAFCVFLIFCVPASAEELTAQPQLTGKWTLTKWVGDHSELVTTGKIEAVPKGVGYKFHSEEFPIPDADRRFEVGSLPKGIHFRVSPARIDNETSVVNVRLTYTTVDTLTDDSFSISSEQTESRQVVEYGKPFSVSLLLRDGKERYKVEFILQRK